MFATCSIKGKARMKAMIGILTLLMFFTSCGSEERTAITASGALTANEFFSVNLIIPNGTVFGATTEIEVKEKRYKVGSQTPNWIRNELDKLPYGLHKKEIIGDFDTESGLFPNPMAEIQVIHILDYR